MQMDGITLNHAVAEMMGAERKPCTCGHPVCVGGWRWHWPKNILLEGSECEGITDNTPNFSRSLDAMALAEKTLPAIAEMHWVANLHEVVHGAATMRYFDPTIAMLKATAKQRALSFVKTVMERGIGL